jgi:hypothetical protein
MFLGVRPTTNLLMEEDGAAGAHTSVYSGAPKARAILAKGFNPSRVGNSAHLFLATLFHRVDPLAMMGHAYGVRDHQRNRPNLSRTGLAGQRHIRHHPQVSMATSSAFRQNFPARLVKNKPRQFRPFMPSSISILVIGSVLRVKPAIWMLYHFSLRRFF